MTSACSLIDGDRRIHEDARLACDARLLFFVFVGRCLQVVYLCLGVSAHRQCARERAPYFCKRRACGGDQEAISTLVLSVIQLDIMEKEPHLECIRPHNGVRSTVIADLILNHSSRNAKPGDEVRVLGSHCEDDIFDGSSATDTRC
jgi:hypothetical protein